jgi:hypothetical protein
MSENKDENVSMSVTDDSNTNVEEPQQDKALNVDLKKTVTVPLYLLVNLRQLIDVSVTRGAYRSTELSSVGKVYDELVEIIKSNVD